MPFFLLKIYLFVHQEYFFADGGVSIYPVSISLMASFMSSITLLGLSTEIYTYGTLFVVINFSYGIATAISAYLYLPVFYKLQATSAYEVNPLEISYSTYIQADIFSSFSICRNASESQLDYVHRWLIHYK